MIDSPRCTIALVIVGACLIGGALAIRHVVSRGDETNVVTEPVSQQFATGGAPLLVIDTFNGDVVVRAADSDAVRVTVTRKGSGVTEEAAFNSLANVEVRMTQDGNTVRVVARLADPGGPKGNGAKVELAAPQGASVEAATTSGEVRSEGLTGSLSLHSTNGAVRVDGAGGAVEAETSNGSVRVASSSPVVARLRTSNGAIEFEGVAGPGESVMETSNGAIRVTLPGDSAFAVEATTTNGSIASDFPLANGTQSRTHLKTVVGGGGGASIRASTTNGKVEIRRRQAAGGVLP